MPYAHIYSKHSTRKAHINFKSLVRLVKEVDDTVDGFGLSVLQVRHFWCTDIVTTAGHQLHGHAVQLWNTAQNTDIRTRSYCFQFLFFVFNSRNQFLSWEYCTPQIWNIKQNKGITCSNCNQHWKSFMDCIMYTVQLRLWNIKQNMVITCSNCNQHFSGLYTVQLRIWNPKQNKVITCSNCNQHCKPVLWTVYRTSPNLKHNTKTWS